MKSKPAIRSFFISTVLMAVNTYVMGQCDLPVPTNSKNLCSQSFSTSLTSTSNTITINNPAVLPEPGTYNVVISYQDEWTGECLPIINCSSVTITSSGSSMTIALGSCASLPSDFQLIHMKYINIFSTPGGYNYFFHYYNGACTLPLINPDSSIYMPKMKSFSYTRYQPGNRIYGIRSY